MTADKALLATEATKPEAGQATTQGGSDGDTQITSEQQVDEKQATAKDEAAEAATDEESKGAPEIYEFDVPKGLPEGFEMDESVLESFVDIARDLDLTQEKAQKLIDKVLPTIHRRTLEQQSALSETWRADTRADKEIGGQKLDENLGIAARAVKAYGNPALQELLNGPLGNHKEVIRFLVKVGKTVSEDKFVSGRQQDSSIDLNDDAVVGKVLYPKSQ